MSGDNVIKGGLVVGLLSMPVAAQGAPSLKPQCRTQLQRDLDAIASQPLFNQARLGIAVQPLQASQPLYTKDAQRYFLPASTTKVMTTAAALTRLGPKFRIQTDLYGAGSGPTLDHLRIVGRGDPTLSDQQLQQIATQLKQKASAKSTISSEMTPIFKDQALFRPGNGKICRRAMALPSIA